MKHMLWLLPSIAAMGWAEHQWPQIALWIFVGLTLTLGFAHGAMDVWLLMDAKQNVVMRHFAAYGACVIVLAAVLSPFPGIALIVLLLLSLWHFGEQADTLPVEARIQSLLRIVQGGASVMLPVLISAQELRVWVQAIAPESSHWVWPVWVGMAGLWLALLVAAIAVVQPWRTSAAEVAKHVAMRALAGELIALVLLNALLSPLLAFALFFGVHHSGMHVWRMRFLQMREAGTLSWVLLGVTLVITWVGLAVLWWQMPLLAQPQQWQGLLQGNVLRWLVVALAAVTLPHMVLVSRARARLFPLS
jgi:Brp/Blh family beta-carotene 15,15'-monooxygenase